MIEKAPVTDFSQLLGDFNQTLQQQKEASSTAYRLKGDVHKKWRELEQARVMMLDSIFQERGLALCSGYHDPVPEKSLKINTYDIVTREYSIDMEELRKLSPEELGVFPKEQVRLHFSRRTRGAYRDNPYLEGEYQYDQLEPLCPKHFPEKTNQSRKAPSWAREKNGEWDIESEVLNKDGRLITKVGNVDVTNMEITERNKDEMVFRYFGLPQLPKEPSV